MATEMRMARAVRRTRMNRRCAKRWQAGEAQGRRRRSSMAMLPRQRGTKMKKPQAPSRRPCFVSRHAALQRVSTSARCCSTSCACMVATCAWATWPSSWRKEAVTCAARKPATGWIPGTRGWLCRTRWTVAMTWVVARSTFPVRSACSCGALTGCAWPSPSTRATWTRAGLARRRLRRQRHAGVRSGSVTEQRGELRGATSVLQWAGSTSAANGTVRRCCSRCCG
mmetsp:Transcript_20558/g.65864  ORF Transcript_20558/g.65864 Transcript_20558/m.65864 type:complete len:225 (-) Transcript_20558:852-1526(-)